MWNIGTKPLEYFALRFQSVKGGIHLRQFFLVYSKDMQYPNALCEFLYLRVRARVCWKHLVLNDKVSCCATCTRPPQRNCLIYNPSDRLDMFRANLFIVYIYLLLLHLWGTTKKRRAWHAIVWYGSMRKMTSSFNLADSTRLICWSSKDDRSWYGVYYGCMPTSTWYSGYTKFLNGWIGLPRYKVRL